MNPRSRRVSIAALAVLAVAALGGTAIAQSAPASRAPGTFVYTPPPGTPEGTVDTSAYAKDGPYRICFSNGFSGNSWRKMMLASLQNEAAKYPDLIGELIVVDGQGDVAKQVADIESCVAQQVDAIMLIPHSGTAPVAAVRSAIDAGIPVVPFNLPLEGDDWTAYLGTNACEKGGALADWLIDALGGKGGIIALGGVPGNSYTAEAWRCAQEHLATSEISVLDYKDANWQEDTAKQVCTDLLTAHPQIDGIWADGSQDAAGCLKAFQAAGRALVPATGDDYNGLLKLYVENAASNPGFDIGTLSEPTYESKLALDMVLGILTGQPNVPHTFTLLPALITGDNAAQFVKSDLPDAVFVDNDLTDAQLQEIFAGG